MIGQPSITTRIAALCIRSRLTPLVIAVSVGLGLFATLTTSKEEEPAIAIPLFDIAVAWPGHPADDVDARVARPVSAWARELPAVDHVTSSASDDAALVTVQFRQGISREQAFTQLSERLTARRALLPGDASAPTATSRGVEDVPVLVFSVVSESSAPEDLRRQAVAVARAIEQQASVASVEVLGGARPAFLVEIDPARLAAHRLDVAAVTGAIQQAQLELPVGQFESGTTVVAVRAGSTIGSLRELDSLPVGEAAAGVVRMRDVARVIDTVREPRGHVAYGDRVSRRGVTDAVMIAVSKVTGANATELTERLRTWMTAQGRQLLPADAQIHVVRDAGETADDRVTTLLEHIATATLVVVVLIGLSLGRREALIVAIVIPTTLAIVPFVYRAAGFTLNRITLAAMIFAIGILVDDAIVVVENMHRRFQDDGGRTGDRQRLAGEAVGEVASPTILATLTVVTALTPTAFVSGMIGQYLRPLPIGASVAMIFSLIVALTVTPYLTYRLLGRPRAGVPSTPRWLTRYCRILAWTLATPRRAMIVALGGVVLLAGALVLLPTRVVLVKLLPNSDAQDMSVVVDLPAGTSLSRTHQELTSLAAALLELPEVSAAQVYSGQPGPVSFQGVARHYMLRAAPHQGEIQLELVARGERSRASHTVANEVRQVAERRLASLGATFTVAEAPSGPPVQAALVAEIYGPTAQSRQRAACAVRDAFLAEPALADVDWSLRPEVPQAVVRTVAENLSLHATVGARLVTSQRALFAGDAVTELELPGEPERVAVIVQAASQFRIAPASVLDQRTVSLTGELVPIADVAQLVTSPARVAIQRKDMLPVAFVTGEMRAAGAPAYAALDVTDHLRRGAADLDVQWAERVPDATRTTVRWAGEWTTTYELFRDLGLAFAVALAAIYVMLVAWYGSYMTPIVVMIPIPLALVGVVPAHFVARTPMSGLAILGLIALAGSMVRNSILLVDFAREHRAAGHSIAESVLRASRERARPILLTAGTVILGDGILFFDPLLEGLGLTMAAGALFSTVLTLILVPIAYVVLETGRPPPAPNAT